MKEPHNYRKVGYSMFVVAAALAIIGIIGFLIGHNVLFGDSIQRAKTAQFNECKASGMAGEECAKYVKQLEEKERSSIP